MSVDLMRMKNTKVPRKTREMLKEHIKVMRCEGFGVVRNAMSDHSRI